MAAAHVSGSEFPEPAEGCRAVSIRPGHAQTPKPRASALRAPSVEPCLSFCLRFAVQHHSNRIPSPVEPTAGASSLLISRSPALTPWLLPSLLGVVALIRSLLCRVVSSQWHSGPWAVQSCVDGCFSTTEP